MTPVSGNRFSISGALGTSLVAIALTSLFVLSGLGTLLATAFGPGTGGVKPEQEVGKLVALHNEQIKTYQDRFNGRSAFFTPPPPPKPPPRDDKGPPPPPPPPPPPAGPPEKYTGPSIRFVVGDTVYFAAATGTGKPFKVNVGETSNGVKVLAVKGGWTVRLGHAGGEYDVPLFPGATEITAMLPSTAKTSPLPAGFIPVVPGGPDLTPRLPAAAAHPTTTTAPDAAAALAEGAETSEQAASNLRTAPLPNGRSGRNPSNPRPATTAPGTVEPADTNNERNQPDNPEDEGSDAENGDDAAPPVAHPRDPGRVDNPPEPEQEDSPASPAPPSTAPATPAPPATAPGPGVPN